jgi:hypothetical protein
MAPIQPDSIPTIITKKITSLKQSVYSRINNFVNGDNSFTWAFRYKPNPAPAPQMMTFTPPQLLPEQTQKPYTEEVRDNTVQPFDPALSPIPQLWRQDIQKQNQQKLLYDLYNATMHNNRVTLTWSAITTCVLLASYHFGSLVPQTSDTCPLQEL